jgi:hypothetical protein
MFFRVSAREVLMPLTYPVDNNGLTYTALGTAAWYGDEGAALRAQGYTYCGFGTFGVYLLAPGESRDPVYGCGKKAGGNAPGPSVIPTVPSDIGATTASPVKPVTDSCGSCHQATSPVVGTPAQPAPPVVPANAMPTVVAKKPFPWWLLIILAILAVSHGRDD